MSRAIWGQNVVQQLDCHWEACLLIVCGLFMLCKPWVCGVHCHSFNDHVLSPQEVQTEPIIADALRNPRRGRRCKAQAKEGLPFAHLPIIYPIKNTSKSRTMRTTDFIQSLICDLNGFNFLKFGKGWYSSSSATVVMIPDRKSVG